MSGSWGGEGFSCQRGPQPGRLRAGLMDRVRPGAQGQPTEARTRGWRNRGRAGDPSHFLEGMTTDQPHSRVTPHGPRPAAGTTASALPMVGPSPVPATSPKGACRRDQLSPQAEWNPAPAACGSPRLDERRAYSTSTCGHKHTPDLEEPICYSWPPPSGPGPSLDPSLLGVGVTSGQPAKGLRVLTSGGPAEAPGHGAGAPQHLEGSRQQASLHGPDLGPPSPRSPRRSRTEEPAQPRTFRLTEGIGYASTVT